MLDRELSRARLTSTGEKRLKTSSVDSGSSQNCELLTGCHLCDWERRSLLPANMGPLLIWARAVTI